MGLGFARESSSSAAAFEHTTASRSSSSPPRKATSTSPSPLSRRPQINRHFMEDNDVPDRGGKEEKSSSSSSFFFKKRSGSSKSSKAKKSAAEPPVDYSLENGHVTSVHNVTHNVTSNTSNVVHNRFFNGGGPTTLDPAPNNVNNNVVEGGITGTGWRAASTSGGGVGGGKFLAGNSNASKSGSGGRLTAFNTGDFTLASRQAKSVDAKLNDLDERLEFQDKRS